MIALLRRLLRPRPPEQCDCGHTDRMVCDDCGWESMRVW